MNPFTKLQQQLRNSRHGNHAADALKLLAPFWEAEWSDTGRTPKNDVLAVITGGSRLEKEMRSLVNSLSF